LGSSATVLGLEAIRAGDDIVPETAAIGADYRCSHSIAISGDGWPVDVRLALRQARRRRKAGFQLDRKQVSMMG
jgi:hypothetical protein